MEEDSELSKNDFCFGCLARNTEVKLCKFNIRNESLRSIFQCGHMTLCYLCKRIANHAELFIQNVQTNQILMENFFNMNNLTLASIKSQSQPVISLVVQSLDIMELGPDCTDSDETCNRKIKMEFEEDYSYSLEELDHHNDDNNGLETEVKEEGEYPLQLLKEELELEGIQKCVRKIPKKSKLKKKKKVKLKRLKEVNEEDTGFKEIGIETIYVSREQCMKERDSNMGDMKYINSAYKCEDCVKGFNFRPSFDKHMEKHNKGNGKFECDICKQRMESDEKLQSHTRYHYLRYRCKECGLTRISRPTVKDHFTATHCQGYYQYSCPHCGKIFKRQVSLRKHIKYSHTKKERVQCAYCDKTYANKESLKPHLILSHPAEVSTGKIPKRHICEECGAGFSGPSQLKNHSIKHSERRDHYCIECDKSFKSEYSLKHHLKTALPHTNYIELPLPCTQCDKRFAIKRDLEKHLNRVHLNIKPFKCDKCDKAYVDSWLLKEHQRLIHEGYKRPLKFPCQFCDKIFDRKQILKGHLRTHTGERPYQCTKCPAQFSQSSILGTHIKLVHLKLTRDGRPKSMVMK